MPYLTVVIPVSAKEAGAAKRRRPGAVRHYADEQASRGYDALLQSSIAATQATLDELGVDYQVLIVYDAGGIEVPGDDGRRVRVVRHPERYGLWQALYLGLLSAKGKLTMYMPAGLTPDAEGLARCLQAAGQVQVVAVTCAQRIVPLSTQAMALAARVLFGLSVNPFPDLCIFHTAVMQEIWVEYPDNEFIKTELLIKACDMGYTPVEMQMHCSPLFMPMPGTTARCGYDLLHFWGRRLFKERRDGRRDWRVGVPKHG